MPKPLLPVGDIPIVEVILRQLAAAGIRETILAVGYQAELIRMLLGDGSRWGMKIRYSEEKQPLGTASPLKLLPNLDNNFLVLNGDILTDLPLKGFMASHLKGGALATVAVRKRKVKVDFGVVESREGLIENYREKPTLNYLVSMGIYAFNKKAVKMIPAGRSDFPDLVKILIKYGQNPRIYPYQGRWYDIGRPDDWEKADHIFRYRSEIFLPK